MGLNPLLGKSEATMKATIASISTGKLPRSKNKVAGGCIKGDSLRIDFAVYARVRVLYMSFYSIALCKHNLTSH